MRKTEALTFVRLVALSPCHLHARPTSSFSRSTSTCGFTGLLKKYVAPTCGSDLIVSIDVSPLTMMIGIVVAQAVAKLVRQDQAVDVRQMDIHDRRGGLATRRMLHRFRPAMAGGRLETGLANDGG